MFGYWWNTLGQLELYERLAAAVPLIYRLYDEGRSLKKIVEALTSYDIPSPYNHSKWG